MAAIPYEPLVIEAIEDPIVVAVLKGVRDLVGRPISGRALRAGAPMSRRGLEQRFRATLGCSPMQAARRVNLERAAEFLCNTNLSIKEIAKHCCFGSAVHLSVAFKRHFNLPPSQFRNHHRRGSSIVSHNGRPPGQAS